MLGLGGSLRPVGAAPLPPDLKRRSGARVGAPSHPSRMDRLTRSDPARRCDGGTPVGRENQRFSPGRSRLYADPIHGSRLVSRLRFGEWIRGLSGAASVTGAVTPPVTPDSGPVTGCLGIRGSTSGFRVVQMPRDRFSDPGRRAVASCPMNPLDRVNRSARRLTNHGRPVALGMPAGRSLSRRPRAVALGGGVIGPRPAARGLPRGERPRTGVPTPVRLG